MQNESFTIRQLDNILFEGDYPEIYIAYAEYEGLRMTQDQIEQLNEDKETVLDLYYKENDL